MAPLPVGADAARTPLLVKMASDTPPPPAWTTKRGGLQLTVIYLVSMVALGLVYSAQGPALLQIANQSNLIPNATSGGPGKCCITRCCFGTMSTQPRTDVLLSLSVPVSAPPPPHPPFTSAMESVPPS
jgi:hypothetical protein